MREGKTGMLLQKKQAGGSSLGFEWPTDGAVVEVPDEVGHELLQHAPWDFVDVTGTHEAEPEAKPEEPVAAEPAEEPETPKRRGPGRPRKQPEPEGDKAPEGEQPATAADGGEG